MTSGIDCQEYYHGMMRCRCKQITDCGYADKCAKYKWLRKDLNLDGFFCCQRPRNEPLEPDEET